MPRLPAPRVAAGRPQRAPGVRGARPGAAGRAAGAAGRGAGARGRRRRGRAVAEALRRARSRGVAAGGGRRSVCAATIPASRPRCGRDAARRACCTSRGASSACGGGCDEPTVAIVGARAASDYGMEVAHGLARGLAASGVTVVSGFAEGIAAAAHAGALEARGPTVTAMAGGVDVCHPASRRALYRRLRETSCALAELPCGAAAAQLVPHGARTRRGRAGAAGDRRGGRRATGRDAARASGAR